MRALLTRQKNSIILLRKQGHSMKYFNLHAGDSVVIGNVATITLALADDVAPRIEIQAHEHGLKLERANRREHNPLEEFAIAASHTRKFALPSNNILIISPDIEIEIAKKSTSMISLAIDAPGYKLQKIAKSDGAQAGPSPENAAA